MTEQNYRYAAFISYSSKDARFARRLHGALEHYGIPASLGKFEIVGAGAKRNRIYPVFRDREELSAGQLGEQIEANLAASAALIVVCSPNSAVSPWVQKEIEFFAAQGRHAKIFAIIPDTAPLTDDEGADATLSCFPPAFRGDALSGDKLEPLAADARQGKDGFRNAWLKIVAGMIGVSPGQLIDRDRRARTQRAVFNALGIVATVFAFGFVLATYDRWRPAIDAALGRYVYYDVLLPQNVREGLGINSRVMFNGIDIGAVQRLSISPDNPERLVARVVVSADVPIRTDSTAEVRPASGDLGLIIAIRPGSIEFPLLIGSDGQRATPRLVAIFGDDAAAFVNRAAIYEAEDDTARAMADYDEAIRRDPQLGAAYHARARLAFRAGDVAAAAADDDRAIALEPSNRRFLSAGCGSHGAWGASLDQALAHCDAALSIEPDHADTLDRRGLVHLRRGEFQAALNDYDAALRTNADMTSALYGRGLARLRLGQSDAGRADVSAASAADESVATYYAGLGLVP
jgi:tetratricopeptide (TPR) repeat protein